MRKIYTLLGCLLLSQLSNKLSAQVLFSENFSSGTGTTPPAGWSNNDMTPASTPYLWAFDNLGGAPITAPMTPPAAVFNNDYLGWSGDYPESALESPTFDASVITDYIYLSFDHTFFNDDFSGDGSYSVEVWDGSTWNSVLGGSGDVSGHVVLDITADANGASDAQVRFVWYGDYSYYWVVDNVQVEVITCAPVTNVLVDAVTPTTAGISWTAQGTETSWNIEYGTSGFTPGTGTPGTSATESFTTSTPLTPNTNYDFYVQADCGAGDESPWIGPISVYTGYCEFEGLDSDYFINNFSTSGGATSNISNLNSGFAANGYEDATAMTVSQFEGGPNVNFNVDFGLPGNTYGFGIWVDWNDNMIFESSEQMFQSNTGYQEDFSGSFGVPVGVAVGNYRMRILADYWNSSPTDACTLNSGEGEAEDYTFVVVPIPSCLPVTDLDTENETPNSIDITWTPGDSETAWNIEWGVPGFVPGTGTGLDSAQQSSTASFSIGGLDPSTVYDIYVQASCSSSDSSYWTLVSGTTLCAPITALPWTEDFEAMTDFDYDLFPLCWSNENGDWLSDNSNNSPGIANSGSNFVGIFWGSNDQLWTPEFQLIAGHKYEFSFMWAGDGYTGWSGSVIVNNSQSSTGATPLGTPFLVPADNANDEYQKEIFCFTPATSGVYTFGVKVSATSSPYFLAFDDFSLIERAATAGTNGSIDACQLNGLVDLNQIATINDPLGSWTFAPNPSTIVNDSMFNPQFVPAGTVSVDYITYGCLVDTASVMVSVYPPSSAGLDGMITACKNEPIDLLSGLNGTVDMGGDWYSPTNTLMPNSQVMTGTFPGQFNYKYITGNGVCPDDTSSVVVTIVGSCDWLSVDENALEEVTVYPNPSTGVIFIESGFTGNFNLVITDVNGRTVQTGQNTISAGTNTVNLKEVERGTYFLKLSSDNAEKVFRVVIQ